jgi:hypothetical protein
MTLQLVPYALQGASHSAAVFRQSASAPFVSGGRLSPLELSVSQTGTASMNVIIGPGRAKVVGSNASAPSGLNFTTQAMYDVLNDANITVPSAATTYQFVSPSTYNLITAWPTADATYSRIDVVALHVEDNAYTSSGVNEARVIIVKGVAAASPTVPGLPASSIPLAYVTLPANATAITNAMITNITDRAKVLGVPTIWANLDVLSSITGMVEGDLVTVREGGAQWEYNGTTWVQKTQASFASAAARTSAYARASGAYLVAGARAYDSTQGLDYYYTGSAWVCTTAGLVPIVPTSVSGTGTSVTADASGKVTVTACSTINLQGIFSSAFRNYRIVWEWTAVTGTTDRGFIGRLLIGAGPVSGADYYLVGTTATVGVGVSIASATGSTYLPLLGLSISNANPGSAGTMDIHNPFVATRTRGEYQASGNTATANQANTGTFYHALSNSYDGFTFGADASGMNLTGTVRVYGYN